ncbi:MAG TPA: RagB/SusD family nutrient uptake outer membrane protein [Ohtaekwangia sp.]|nr:RagB/SusD family nutrient uptake outer membrane protein [Ohtaekwangia sp.]
MKKIKYIIMIAMVLILGSCGEEFLDIKPKDQLTVEGFYRNAEEIRMVTGAIYGQSWFDANDKFLWAAGDGLPGDLYQDYEDEGQLFFHTFTDQNTVILQGWRGLYRVVAAANTVINGMPAVASDNGAPESAINGGLGEARFLRATAYFFLTEFWGDVPVISDAAADVANNEITPLKNTRETIYDFIIGDLEFAAENLPLSDQPGRVTSWSAKGMLAKVYLTKGQSTQDANDFTMAKQYAQDVIENSGLSLLPDYADLFTIQGNNNPESLFALQWTSGSYGVGNSRQAVFARGSNLTGISEGWGGYKSATLSFMDNVASNAGSTGAVPNIDKRRSAIYMQLGDHYSDMHAEFGGYTYNIYYEYPEDYADPLLAGTNEGAAPLLNNIKKYVLGTANDVGTSISNQAVPLNQYILRLADVYLVYAEAAIGPGSSVTDATNDPAALEYYHMVRDRGVVQANGELTARKTSITFEDVFNERRVEFGMEGINWFDVKRRFYRNPNEAIQYLNTQRTADRYRIIDNGSDNETRNTWAAYELDPTVSPLIATEEKMFLPIPASEVTVNPNLAADIESEPYTTE